MVSIKKIRINKPLQHNKRVKLTKSLKHARIKSKIYDKIQVFKLLKNTLIMYKNSINNIFKQLKKFIYKQFCYSYLVKSKYVLSSVLNTYKKKLKTSTLIDNQLANKVNDYVYVSVTYVLFWNLEVFFEEKKLKLHYETISLFISKLVKQGYANNSNLLLNFVCLKTAMNAVFLIHNHIRALCSNVIIKKKMLSLHKYVSLNKNLSIKNRYLNTLHRYQYPEKTPVSFFEIDHDYIKFDMREYVSDYENRKKLVWTGESGYVRFIKNIRYKISKTMVAYYIHVLYYYRYFSVNYIVALKEHFELYGLYTKEILLYHLPSL